jgi:hypothetical protein
MDGESKPFAVWERRETRGTWCSSHQPNEKTQCLTTYINNNIYHRIPEFTYRLEFHNHMYKYLGLSLRIYQPKILGSINQDREKGVHVLLYMFQKISAHVPALVS